MEARRKCKWPAATAVIEAVPAGSRTPGGPPPHRRGPSTRTRKAVWALAVLAVAMLPQLSLAQDRPAVGRPSALGAATVGPPPRLEVPALVIGAPATQASLGISLTGGERLPPNSYVRIRGLPAQMSLSDGHIVAPGAWAVSVAALPGLRVVIPPAAAGKSDVSIAVVAIDGGVVAEAKTTLVVAPAALGEASPDRAAAEPKGPALASRPASPPPAPLAALPAPAPAPAPVVTPRPAPPAIAALPPAGPPAAPTTMPRSEAAPPLSAADRERAQGFLARGRTLLAAGDVASARLFFRRSADAGLAEAALAMGTTFDPAELDRLNAVGILADPAEARRWYERARDLGAGPAAEQRLQRLGSR